MPCPPARKVLLVGWDAADWQIIHPLIDAGLMPTLARLVSEGTMGDLRTLQPMLSPMLWTSIATGKRAPEHGILGFVEPSPDATHLQPVQSTSRTCKALWNILSQAGKRCHAIGWYASHPAEAIEGVCVSNQFPLGNRGDAPPAGSVCPPEFAERLADLRLAPDELDPAFVRSFLPRLAEFDRTMPEVNRLVQALETRLAECITIHSVATELIEHEPWEFATVYYECIDQLGHDFMPFHPPRLPSVSAQAFDAFQGVMKAAYCFHDLMLARLLELAGPETHLLLVSDHGFLNDHRRPLQAVEAAQWHRPEGVFLLHGPGIKPDASLTGANLLDIAPTVLTLLGLPVGRDMAGQVLSGAWQVAPDVTWVESWELIPDPTGRAAPARVAADRAAEEAALRQLVELGYLAAPGADQAANLARAARESRFNLAAALADGGRIAEALPLAESLCHDCPEEPRFAAMLGQLGLAARDPGAVQRAIERLSALQPENPRLFWLRGLHAALQGQWEDARRDLAEAASRAPHDGWLQTKLGRIHLRLREWPAAEGAFRRALELDPADAEACYGLSVALPRQNRPEEGLTFGLRAITLQPAFPEAHFQLGAVFSRLSWFERAAEAMEQSLAMRPGFLLAHRYLSRIYGRLGRTETAARHRVKAEQIAAANLPQPAAD